MKVYADYYAELLASFDLPDLATPAEVVHAARRRGSVHAGPYAAELRRLRNREKKQSERGRGVRPRHNYRPEYMRAYNRSNPKVSIGGHDVRANSLPAELRAVALLIQETRREIRNRRGTTA